MDRLENTASEKPDQTPAAALFQDFIDSTRDYFKKVNTLVDRAESLATTPESSAGKIGGIITVADTRAALAAEYPDQKPILNADKRQVGTEFRRSDGTLAAVIKPDGEFTQQIKYDQSGKTPTELNIFDRQGKRFVQATYDKSGNERARVAFHDDGVSPELISRYPTEDPNSRMTRDHYREDGSRWRHEVSYKNAGKVATDTTYGADGTTKQSEKTFHPDSAENTTTKFDAAGNVRSVRVNKDHATQLRADGTRSKDTILFRDGNVETNYAADGETIDNRVWHRKDGTIESRLSRGEPDNVVIEEQFHPDGKTVAERGVYQNDFSAVITRFTAAGKRTEEVVVRKDGSTATTTYKADGVTHAKSSSTPAGERMLSMPGL